MSSGENSLIKTNETGAGIIGFEVIRDPTDHQILLQQYYSIPDSNTLMVIGNWHSPPGSLFES